MPQFNVYIAQVVSTGITVEAESAEEASEIFYDSDDMPGSLTHGAFGNGATVDESGEWMAVSVTASDNNREELWADPNPFGHPVSVAALAIDAAYSDDDTELLKILAGLSAKQLHDLAGAAGHLKSRAGRLAPQRAAAEIRNKNEEN